MAEFIDTLAWDTEFFSVPIGRINVSGLDEDRMAAVLHEAQQDGLRCLYFEVDPHDRGTVRAVERHGFLLVDVRVVLEYSFDRHSTSSLPDSLPGLVVDDAVESDLPRLEEIAAQVGEYSRFVFDETFGPEAARRLFRAWIRRSLHGRTDVVLVARKTVDRATAIGLITSTATREIGRIELAGVDREHRRAGAGAALVQAILDRAERRGIRRIHVVTQARNVAAQRLYQRMGFLTTSMTLYYHKWCGSPPSVAPSGARDQRA